MVLNLTAMVGVDYVGLYMEDGFDCYPHTIKAHCGHTLKDCVFIRKLRRYQSYNIIRNSRKNS